MGETKELSISAEELSVNDILLLAPKADVNEDNIDEIRQVIGWFGDGKEFKVTQSNYKKSLNECRMVIKHRDVLEPLQEIRRFNINNRLTNLLPKLIDQVDAGLTELSASNAGLLIEKIGKLLKKKDGDTAAPIQVNVNLAGTLTAAQQQQEIAEILANMPGVGGAISMIEDVVDVDVECEDV